MLSLSPGLALSGEKQILILLIGILLNLDNILIQKFSVVPGATVLSIITKLSFLRTLPIDLQAS